MVTARSAGQPDCSGVIPMAEPSDEQQDGRSRSGALIGLIIVLVLVVAALYLVHALRKEGQLEDCLMSGRTNCAPIETPTTGR
jgi:hypothetical protein